MPNSRYDVLFQPISIGPVTAKNRFYQVPHCTGMGYRYPQSEARFRGIKAEGGWSVVSTQEAEIHKSSDISPANEARIWDESDIPALRLMTDAVHEHGSLAAIQLVHNGLHTANLYSRVAPLAPSAAPVDSYSPIQAREMSKRDIKAFRQWHAAAAKRAVTAGFDIVYAYAGHDMTLLQHFLLQRHNHRSDEYGGSLTNRLRLFQEVIADTRDAIGDDCALAVRLAVDELLGDEGLQHNAEAQDIIEALAEEPDLWDVNLSGWANDSQSARFSDEGFQEPYTKFVKSVTTKPVVGVGRYTSPDTMVRLITSGHLDFIGAARPSIADPFLPKKIEQGRLDEIRECIGCNICVSGDNTCVPMRCTQNPAVGEEWRRGWHPEFCGEKIRIEPTKTSKKSSANKDQAPHCLIVGGGPAGLEAARVLGERGFQVSLAEASTQWGGRVCQESALPGLSSWQRVCDWRLAQLQRMSNVGLYLDNELSAEDVLSFDAQHVAIATGARWRDDGVGREHRRGIVGLVPEPGVQSTQVLSVNDVLTRALSKNEHKDITSPVVIYDDDHFYLASVLAEKMVSLGYECVLVTPAPVVASWSQHTLEQARIQQRLLSLGVMVITNHRVYEVRDGFCVLSCVYTNSTLEQTMSRFIPVTSRAPNHRLYNELIAQEPAWADTKLTSVKSMGDCYAPGLIAGAVHAGHAYGRGLCVEAQTPRREDGAR